LRIYLIGFMGSGKSFLGRKLAYQLGINFLDLDEYIEKKSRTTISKIFENKGEAAFRRIETEALIDTFVLENIIIGTGGGTPCYFNNIEKMRENGLVIFINPTVDILVKRLEGEKDKRPLIKNEPNLKTFIKKKLKQRLPDYTMANLIYEIKEEDPDLSDLAEFLKGFLVRN